MAKLYPPQIESSLPAFFGSVILIPFELNRAVGRNEFDEMSIIVKTVSTSTQKIITKTDKIIERENKYYAEFKMDDTFIPQVGQYYKIQVAFINKKTAEIGYYSTAGIIKCTAKPNIYIQHLNDNLNINTYQYIGYYEHDEDIAEKVYSYRFDLKDRNDNIVATSGEQVHNSSNDIDSYSSFDKWNLTKTLEYGQTYYLTYSIKTVNNLEIVSASYLVRDVDTVDLELDIEFFVENNYEEGCNSLILNGTGKKPITGNFIIVRRDIEEDKWCEVYRFNAFAHYFVNEVLWEDYTIEQGRDYEYALQAYNNRGMYSNKFYAINKLTNDKNIKADFEHAFLFDGERQLKIKYNPKITSFKSTILESKVDTLGGPHPFFFRNGNVKYKEFPISGFISILSDPEERFVQGVRPQDPSRIDTPANQKKVEDLGTWLTSENFQREREFKLEVLEWLTNGQPKLFRSPGEGNYIVRLMNSSLTPNDTLGRMLHTFNCTAYEIASFDYENLIKYGFIKNNEPDNGIVRYNQISLSDTPADEMFIFPYQPTQLKIINAMPGSVIGIHFLNGEEIQPIGIGVTGTYVLEANEKPIYGLSLLTPGTGWKNLTIEYSYKDTKMAEFFNHVATVEIVDKIIQYVGEGEKVNFIPKVEDIRRKVKDIYYLKVMPRKIVPLYVKNGIYYRDKKYEIRMDAHDWSELSLYKIGNNYYNYPNFTKPVELSYMVRIGNNPPIDFGGNDWNHGVLPRTFGRYEAIYDLSDIEYLSAGTGVVLDIGIAFKEYEYVIESYNNALIELREQWLQAQERFNYPLPNEDNKQLKQDMLNKYNIYVNRLTEEVERVLREESIV